MDESLSIHTLQSGHISAAFAICLAMRFLELNCYGQGSEKGRNLYNGSYL